MIILYFSQPRILAEGVYIYPEHCTTKLVSRSNGIAGQLCPLLSRSLQVLGKGLFCEIFKGRIARANKYISTPER